MEIESGNVLVNVLLLSLGWVVCNMFGWDMVCDLGRDVLVDNVLGLFEIMVCSILIG